MVDSDVFVQALGKSGRQLSSPVCLIPARRHHRRVAHAQALHVGVREDEAVAMAAGASWLGKSLPCSCRTPALGTSLNTLPRSI